MPALIKEPLVQFLLTGALIFIGYQWLSPPPTHPEQEIVISAKRLEQLSAGFERTWKRSPSAAELKTLVNDYVLEEVYYREARALGLDQDDLIIRRRLQQKMIFLTEPVSSKSQVTDEQLQMHLQHHSEVFRQPTLYTFDQLIFKGVDGYQRSIVALDSARYQGDTSMLPKRLSLIPSERITHQFGDSFRQAAEQAPVEQWHGPVKSSYGWHLIYIHQVIPSKLPPLAEIRTEVAHHLHLSEKQQHRKEVDDTLTGQYQVRIDWSDIPESSANILRQLPVVTSQ